jgi:hypothetical protein
MNFHSPALTDVRSPYADPALAFALTVLIEWPMLAWLSRLGLRRTGLFCLLMNGVTWGVAMGVLARWPVPVPALEAAVIVAEAALLAGFWHWSWRRALPISLALNLTSWLLGVPLMSLLIRTR